tara:strand:+ start:142 stop:1065 length:924 start_codon:yes stop_codon:yes gene_type:complete
MPAKSKQQQKFMGLVHAYKKGEVPASQVSKAVKDAAKSMSGKSVKKYAKTKHDDLPKKVSEKYNYKKAREKFKKTGELPDHLKKLVKDLDKLEKKYKVTNIVVPGLEWMADLGEAQKKFGVEEVKKAVLEACQKGYMTHPTRKTKIMFGKRYRNCIKKEDVNEYTYGVGDIVKDINPTCPHHGAIGKVKSVNPKSVVFVVMNKGKTYKPGDVLDKTHDQMKKMKLGENLQDRMKDVMKSLAKSLKLKSVVSMHTGSGSFSYFMDDKSEVNKLASMLKKKLKRVRIINLDKSKGDTANFVVAADLFNI